MSAASRRSWRARPPNCAAWTAWSAATSIRPQIRQIGDVLYLNDGDWVESCTALVEDARGHLEIVRWAAAVSTPAYSRRSRSPKPRLYPRRIRRVTAGGLMPAGRFPVPGQEHLKILIVTDAWRPQVNGVVTHAGDAGPRSARAGP